MAAKDERLYLRINAKLKVDAEDYAARHGTTLSALTTKFLQELLRREAEQTRKQTTKKFF